MKAQSVIPATPTQTSSPLISVSAALGGIVILILVVAWIAKRFGFAGTNISDKKNLRVSASVSLGSRERVVIVDVDDARLVLGVTASQITHLHTLPPAAESEQVVLQNNSADFQGMMKKLLKRNGKA